VDGDGCCLRALTSTAEEEDESESYTEEEEDKDEENKEDDDDNNVLILVVVGLDQSALECLCCLYLLMIRRNVRAFTVGKAKCQRKELRVVFLDRFCTH